MRTIAELYTARNNLIEQLERRGFDVTDYKEFTMEQVATMVTDKTFDLLLTDPTQKRIFVKFVEGRPDVLTIADNLFKPNFPDPPILRPSDDLLIITYDECLNETVSENLGYLWEHKKIYAAVYSVPRLQCNILDHIDVPAYTILTDQQRDSVTTKYQSPLTQFPRISRHDPAAIVIGLRPGQMVKRVSSSATSLLVEFYRVCVQP